MPCLLKYSRLRGCHLRRLHLSAQISKPSDLFLLRLYLPNLERLEGKLTLLAMTSPAHVAPALLQAPTVLEAVETQVIQEQRQNKKCS